MALTGTKRVKIGLLCTQMNVMKGSWAASEILVLPGSLISWYVTNVLGRCLVTCDIGVFLFLLLPVDI